MTTLAQKWSQRYNAKLDSAMRAAFEARNPERAARIIDAGRTATDQDNAILAAREAGFRVEYYPDGRGGIGVRIGLAINTQIHRVPEPLHTCTSSCGRVDTCEACQREANATYASGRGW